MFHEKKGLRCKGLFLLMMFVMFATTRPSDSCWKPGRRDDELGLKAEDLQSSSFVRKIAGV